MPSAVLAACPLCKDALAQGPLGFAKGFYWSILFMLAAVFSVVGVIAWVIARGIRKTNRASKLAEPAGWQGLP